MYIENLLFDTARAGIVLLIRNPPREINYRTFASSEGVNDSRGQVAPYTIRRRLVLGWPTQTGTGLRPSRFSFSKDTYLSHCQ
jgi:hypothetical protein